MKLSYTTGFINWVKAAWLAATRAIPRRASRMRPLCSRTESRTSRRTSTLVCSSRRSTFLLDDFGLSDKVPEGKPLWLRQPLMGLQLYHAVRRRVTRPNRPRTGATAPPPDRSLLRRRASVAGDRHAVDAQGRRVGRILEDPVVGRGQFHEHLLQVAGHGGLADRRRQLALLDAKARRAARVVAGDTDRKSVGEGKRGAGGVDLGG